MRIAILALQGAFVEHQQMLQKIGVDSVLIRNIEDWNAAFSKNKDASCHGLIIPGGESTAMMRIIRDENLFNPVRETIKNGLPVFGTCAGLIMLDKEHLNTMHIKAKRNAYGRQLGSFHTIAEFNTLGRLPFTFIRAPYIEQADEKVEILSVVDGRIVAARENNQLVTAFHPELDDNTSIHQYFIDMVLNNNHAC